MTITIVRQRSEAQERVSRAAVTARTLARKPVRARSIRELENRVQELAGQVVELSQLVCQLAGIPIPQEPSKDGDNLNP